MMEEFRGTPGPWRAEKTSRAVGPVSKDDDQSSGMVIPVAWVEFDMEVEIQAANQKLIAAAPELLEALQRLVGAECHSVRNSTVHNNALKNALSAIDKALGK